MRTRNYVIWNSVTKLWNRHYKRWWKGNEHKTFPIYFCLIYLDFIHSSSQLPREGLQFDFSLFFVCVCVGFSPLDVSRSCALRYTHFSIGAIFGRCSISLCLCFFFGSFATYLSFSPKERESTGKVCPGLFPPFLLASVAMDAYPLPLLSSVASFVRFKPFL